jgi:hypothetical protein
MVDTELLPPHFRSMNIEVKIKKVENPIVLETFKVLEACQTKREKRLTKIPLIKNELSPQNMELPKKKQSCTKEN